MPLREGKAMALRRVVTEAWLFTKDDGHAGDGCFENWHYGYRTGSGYGGGWGYGYGDGDGNGNEVTYGYGYDHGTCDGTGQGAGMFSTRGGGYGGPLYG